MSPNTGYDSTHAATTKKPSSPSDPTLVDALKGLGHRSTVSECFHFLYIEHGYRQTKTFRDTFYTLFSFHNETMNIWSHFIGFICVVLAGINISFDILASAASSDTSYLELFAVEGFMCCAAICLLLSTLYHWFGCMSEYCHECLLKCDLTGVALLVSGSFFPAAYYGFYCLPEMQKIYFGVTVGILLVGLAAPWIEWTLFGHPVKPFIFASLVVFGLFPCIHWFLVTPTIFTDDLIWNFFWMFFWYTAGFLTWFSRIPERFFPNSLIATHVIPSHTIWHICVLNAVYVWFNFVLTYRAKLQEFGCSAYRSCDADSSCDML